MCKTAVKNYVRILWNNVQRSLWELADDELAAMFKDLCGAQRTGGEDKDLKNNSGFSEQDLQAHTLCQLKMM